MPHFCAEAGHTLLSQTQAEGGAAYLIRKRPA